MIVNSTSYVGRPESGGAAPGIDVGGLLAKTLGTSVADLVPESAPPDTLAVLQGQARALFDALLRTADRETLLMLNPWLARLVEGTVRDR